MCLIFFFYNLIVISVTMLLEWQEQFLSFSIILGLLPPLPLQILCKTKFSHTGQTCGWIEPPASSPAYCSCTALRSTLPFPGPLHPNEAWASHFQDPYCWGLQRAIVLCKLHYGLTPWSFEVSKRSFLLSTSAMKTNLRSISEDGGGLLPSPETRVKLGWSWYSKEEEIMGGSGGSGEARIGWWILWNSILSQLQGR